MGPEVCDGRGKLWPQRRLKKLSGVKGLGFIGIGEGGGVVGTDCSHSFGWITPLFLLLSVWWLHFDGYI